MSLSHKFSRWLGWEAPLTNIAAGHAAPGFTLKSLDGKEFALGKLLEKGPVVVAFFKISCPVCQFTVPYLQRLAERYAGDSATVIGVSQDDVRGTKEFNREYGVTFPTLLDEPGYPASNAYGLTMVPTIFLIEPDGKVKVSCMGFDKRDLEKIAGELSQRRKIAAAPLFRLDEVVPAQKPG
jgi:peroxiredoxin